MRKARAKNIGTIQCPVCQDIAAVREKSNGKRYAYCGDCGFLNLSLANGQRWLQTASIWEGEAPPGTPEWITENRAWKRSDREELAARDAILPSPTIEVERKIGGSVLDSIL